MEKPAPTSHKTLSGSERVALSGKERIRYILSYCGKKVVENNLLDVASSISFTVILSIVPVLAIMLAIFSMLPEFGIFQHSLETTFARGMIPGNIARTVRNHLSAFAANATNVSIIGGLALLFTTLTTISTIESTFNRIWHILTPRPLARRLMLYLLIAFTAPFLLGISIYLTTHLILSRHGLIGWLPFLNTISAPLAALIWTTIGFTLLYRILPNRLVLWRDAVTGGLVAATAFEIAIRLFAFFIVNFSSYEKIYGALAVFPIFMMWVYISSLIMLIGATIVAAMPDIRSGGWRNVSRAGDHFSAAMKIIASFYHSGQSSHLALSRIKLEKLTHLGVSEVEYCLQKLEKLGWITVTKASMMNTFSLSKRHPREWIWKGNAHRITVADVFRHFAFMPSTDDPLTMVVDRVVGRELDMTLSEYFRVSRNRQNRKPENERFPRTKDKGSGA